MRGGVAPAPPATREPAASSAVPTVDERRTTVLRWIPMGAVSRRPGSRGSSFGWTRCGQRDAGNRWLAARRRERPTRQRRLGEPELLEHGHREAEQPPRGGHLAPF